MLCLHLIRTKVFILHISGQEDVCIGLGSINQGLKSPIVFMSNHLVVGGIFNAHFLGWNTNVYRVCIELWWSCEDTSLTLRSVKTIGTLDYPQKSPTENLSTPKYSGISTMESMNNRSHQASSRILIGLYFSVLCNTKPGDDCLT